MLAWMVVDLKAALLILAPAYLGGQFILLIANLITSLLDEPHGLAI